MRWFKISYKMLLPGLLAGLLLLSFVMNEFSHFMISEQRITNTFFMKLPLDNAAVIVPSEIVKFAPFEVTLQFDTKRLANRINKIVASASQGASIQNIVGAVSSRMKAEVVGEDFRIEPLGPQEALIMVKDETIWAWRMSAEESGRYIFKFRLHLLTHDAGQESEKIVDVAEANVFVQENQSTWLRHKWSWVVTLLMLLVIGWGLHCRFRH